MKIAIRTVRACVAVSAILPLGLYFSAPARAAEDCFMVAENGQRIDLGDLCYQQPAPAPSRLPVPEGSVGGTAPTPRAQTEPRDPRCNAHITSTQWDALYGEYNQRQQDIGVSTVSSYMGRGYLASSRLGSERWIWCDRDNPDVQVEAIAFEGKVRRLSRRGF